MVTLTAVARPDDLYLAVASTVVTLTAVARPDDSYQAVASTVVAWIADVRPDDFYLAVASVMTLTGYKMVVLIVAVGVNSVRLMGHVDIEVLIVARAVVEACRKHLQKQVQTLKPGKSWMKWHLAKPN